jgi:putative transposase
MVRKKVYSVNHVISRDELENRIKKVEVEVRILKRLYFIRHLYLGDNIEEAAEKVCISVPTGYEWLKRWNEGGYECLIPQFAGGAPGKLTLEQQNILDQHIKNHDPITSKEVKKFIKTEFGVEYSDMHIWRILRGKNLYYGKPFVKDIRRPDNAEEILKKNSMM